jgi:hypothetical protein
VCTDHVTSSMAQCKEKEATVRRSPRWLAGRRDQGAGQAAGKGDSTYEP